ncbi:unnamed protein product [Rotaria magnacalcarata]|uniref:Uncharacterized protein n=1 Tax=Rotaria magnacalcarata TaxID=392030 RepID=A0A819JDR8_9BILA|nr:unnamed protein product [Rotaria magnacalcarata]CAF3928998.1 unnamed protein product [Rotaria magnacalcarata]
MTSNKRIKRIKAIDSFDFELFVRAHLSTDLADTLILKLGIRTHNGFIECEHFQEELLAVYNSMNEKDKQNLFLYDTSSSLSTPTQVKPGILREFNIFRQECKIYVNNQKNNDINSDTIFFLIFLCIFVYLFEGNSSSTQGELGSLDRSKRFKSSSKIYRSIMGTIACNNKDDEEKFNFRQA